MSFASNKGLATDSVFRTKVEMAMIKIAADVAGETPVSPPKDDKRHNLTQNVYSDRIIWLDRFSHSCAALGTLSTSSSDIDIQNAVSSLWNDLAGVTGLEA